MIEIFFVALVFAFVAGVTDLKTAQVPDQIPAFMITIGIIYNTILSFSTGDMSFVIYSLLFTAIFLGIGALLYYSKSWGEADSWLLGSVFSMIPLYNGIPFLIYYMPFLIGTIAAYTFAYIFILSLKNRKVAKNSLIYTFQNFKPILFSGFFMFVISYVIARNLVFSFSITALTLILFSFLFYSKFIDKKLMRKRINVKDLKEDDVILGGKITEVTEEGIRELSRKQKTVVIVDGIRIIPVFFISLLLVFILL